jgi:dolichol-phosphate mannosyltransferase
VAAETVIPVRDSSSVKRTFATLDLVIPIYDEALVLPALFQALRTTFTPEACSRLEITSVNCLFVDDGSRDSSVAAIQAETFEGLGVRILSLSRNFGHQAAISAGVAESSADLVAVMDADLQDPPECILEMIEEWRKGFEVVYGKRANRKEGLLKRFLYASFYRLFRLLSPIDVPVDAGDFCLMSRRAVDELNRLPESVRFPRGLRAWIGFPQTAVQYDRSARAAGQSSYGWGDLYNLATEGIASMSLKPLKLAQLLAILYLLLSLGGLTALLLNIFERPDIQTQLSMLLVLLVASSSLILFCLYILGAYLGRAYLEVKGRPSYIVYKDLVVREPTDIAREPSSSSDRGAEADP